MVVVDDVRPSVRVEGEIQWPVEVAFYDRLCVPAIKRGGELHEAFRDVLEQIGDSRRAIAVERERGLDAGPNDARVPGG